MTAERPTPPDARTGSWIGAPADPVALAAWQLQRAWDGVERVVATNPWYAPRLVIPRSRDARAFASLATTTKDDVVADCLTHPPFGTRTTCSAEAITSVVETSGTSGRGREVYALDADDEAAIVRTEAVGFHWAGVTAGSRVLLTFPVGTAAAGQWFYGGLRLLGANTFAVGALPTDVKVDVLGRFGADLVIGTPSYAQRLGHACSDAGLDPSSLNLGAVLIGGEPYSVAWARRLSRLWGAPVYEQYGCTERAIAWACPGGVLDGTSGDNEHGVLHFPADNAYIEVIDPATGEHVADGEWGEIVVTPLQAHASPLIRFATRDRVQWRAAGTCRCGRPLPGITAGSVQRYDDMVKVRGVNVWPRTVDAHVLGIDGVGDYRATITRSSRGDEIVTCDLEVLAGVTDADHVAAVVEATFRDTCKLRVTVRVTEPGAITNSVPEGFVKVNRWSDRRNESERVAQLRR